jgi:hypothetical protein
MGPLYLPPGLDVRGLLRPVDHFEHEARERDMGFRRTIRKQFLLPAERSQFLGRPRCDQFVGPRRMPHPIVQTEKQFVGGDGLLSPATLEPGGLQGGGRLRLERPAKESMQGCAVRHEVVGDQVRAHPASKSEERNGHFHDFFIRISNGASASFPASLLRKGHIQLTQIPQLVQQEAPPRALGRNSLTEGPEEWHMNQAKRGNWTLHTR